nr:MAG TPA: hypothetical protein [Caudoviricetes sp.]
MSNESHTEEKLVKCTFLERQMHIVDGNNMV